jgi:toxin ParE1/3/4
LDAARRYQKAWQSAFDTLAEMPGLGAPRDYGNPKFTGVRVWPVPGFKNYLIFYQFTEVELNVLRVLHGARDIPRLLLGDGY